MLIRDSGYVFVCDDCMWSLETNTYSERSAERARVYAHWSSYEDDEGKRKHRCTKCNGYEWKPAPISTWMSSKPDWCDTLGVGYPTTRVAVEAAYRKLAFKHHPDHGGSVEMMQKINVARDQAMKVL